MQKKADMNKILRAALIIFIIIAAAVLLYVNLPQDNTMNQNGDSSLDESETPEISLNISYGQQTLQYTFEDIEKMQNTTGTARYLKAHLFFKSDTIIIDPAMNETANQYTGVKISTIIENLENLPTNYTVKISAPDGYNTTFNNTEINGHMTTYNETGNESLNEVSVILAYKQNGEYLTEKGPLRVAIVGDEPISLSNHWVSNVADIEITE